MQTEVSQHHRLKKGLVVSDQMDKTVIVEYEFVFEHPHTGKIMKSKKKYKVHDPENQAAVGDYIEFFEGRPLSKTKYMYLKRVVKNL